MGIPLTTNTRTVLKAK
jgi:hypothetical protein